MGILFLYETSPSPPHTDFTSSLKLCTLREYQASLILVHCPYFVHYTKKGKENVRERDMDSTDGAWYLKTLKNFSPQFQIDKEHIKRVM